jgi:SAM-dependent methyltransferase
MPSLEENITGWSDPKVWQRWDLGESWSTEFGNTEIMWNTYIYPRIYRFLKDKDVLEIAPGTGRITQYLLPLSKTYIGYDISDYCVNYCKERFGDKFFLNDGKSFKNTKENSIDFIFSWDSLVHAEEDIIFNYVEESIRCLRDKGIAFIHHSNLKKINHTDNPHWRGLVSGSNVKHHIESLGGSVLLQEFLTWDTENGEYSDCITVFSKKEGLPFRMVNNSLFGLLRKHNKEILLKYGSIEGS